MPVVERRAGREILARSSPWLICEKQQEGSHSAPRNPNGWLDRARVSFELESAGFPTLQPAGRGSSLKERKGRLLVSGPHFGCLSIRDSPFMTSQTGRIRASCKAASACSRCPARRPSQLNRVVRLLHRYGDGFFPEAEHVHHVLSDGVGELSFLLLGLTRPELHDDMRHALSPSIHSARPEAAALARQRSDALRVSRE